MFGLVKEFVAEEAGATVVEYGLLAALISIAIIATLQILGQSLVGVFSLINGAL